MIDSIRMRDLRRVDGQDKSYSVRDNKDPSICIIRLSPDGVTGHGRYCVAVPFLHMRTFRFLPLHDFRS